MLNDLLSYPSVNTSEPPEFTLFLFGAFCNYFIPNDIKIVGFAFLLFCGSLEHLCQLAEKVFLGGVWVDAEIGVAREHRRELGLRSVVEQVAGNVVRLGVSQFVAHTHRGAGTFTDEQVALAQPGCVLVVDLGVPRPTLFGQVQLRTADVLGQHGVGLVDEGNHPSVEVGIDATASDGACEIDFPLHRRVHGWSSL